MQIEQQHKHKKQQTITFEFAAPFHASLFYAFDLLGAAQLVGRGKQVLEALGNKLGEEKLLSIKKSWQAFYGTALSSDDWDKLLTTIYGKQTRSITNVKNAIGSATGNPGLAQEITESMRAIDPLIKGDFQASSVLSPKLYRNQLEKDAPMAEIRALLGKFRNFVGEYAEPPTPTIRVVLVWQPETSYTGSSRIYPNTVILGENSSAEAPNSAGVLFHEALHLQFNPFQGKLHEALIKYGFGGKTNRETRQLITDFNEGIAYLWHYEYFCTECLGKNEGRLESDLQSTNRWNPQHLAYALELKPLVDKYRMENKSMDNKFFSTARNLYFQLRTNKPEYFDSPA